MTYFTLETFLLVPNYALYLANPPVLAYPWFFLSTQLRDAENSVGEGVPTAPQIPSFYLPLPELPLVVPSSDYVELAPTQGSCWPSVGMLCPPTPGKNWVVIKMPPPPASTITYTANGQKQVVATLGSDDPAADATEGDFKAAKSLHEKLPLVWALYVQPIAEADAQSSFFGSFFENTTPNQPQYMVTHMRRGYICPKTGDLEVAEIVPGSQKYSIKLLWPRPLPTEGDSSASGGIALSSAGSTATSYSALEEFEETIERMSHSGNVTIKNLMDELDAFEKRLDENELVRSFSTVNAKRGEDAPPIGGLLGALSSYRDGKPTTVAPARKTTTRPLNTPKPTTEAPISAATSSDSNTAAPADSSSSSSAASATQSGDDQSASSATSTPSSPASYAYLDKDDMWRWEPRLEAAFFKVREILQDSSSINPTSFGAVLASINAKENRTVHDVNESLDKVAWLLNGLPHMEAPFQRLMESTDLMWRTRYLTSLLKARFLPSRFGYTAAERKKHMESFLEGLSGGHGHLNSARQESRQFADQYRKQAEALPEAVREDVLQQINRLTPNAANESSTTKRVLDFIFELPWNKASEDVFDMQKARQVLDEKHYGMDEVKQRVLELLAVNKLTGKFARGKVLALLGPPGTGKTTIASSIAASLGRSFGTISIGGLWDLSDLKGFRRTYMASMAGQLLRTIAQCKTNNPVILLDEIDKLAPGSQVTTALLEILDPAQQSTYTDVWVDIPFDISNVLFVCTANWEESIHPALRDRLEVITLEGYLEAEKFEIARRHLLPKCLRNAGLTEGEHVSITDEALQELVKHYSPMQPGVRELETQLQTIVNGISLAIARGTSTAPVQLDLENFESWLPKAEFHKFRHETLPQQPGCVHALTTLGVQQVEAVSFPTSHHGHSSYHATGNLDEVMKESSQLAYTYVTNALCSPEFIAKQPENHPGSFFTTHSVHLHLPKGGQSKTGVHAGAAIALSLLSLALNRPVPEGWSIGGELTLLGRVLPISHLKRIVHAAHLHKMTKLIIPADNKIHWDELPASLKDGITPHFVSWFHEIASIIFKVDLPRTVQAPIVPATPKVPRTRAKPKLPVPLPANPAPAPAAAADAKAPNKRKTPVAKARQAANKAAQSL